MPSVCPLCRPAALSSSPARYSPPPTPPLLFMRPPWRVLRPAAAVSHLSRYGLPAARKGRLDMQRTNAEQSIADDPATPHPRCETSPLDSVLDGRLLRRLRRGQSLERHNTIGDHSAIFISGAVGPKPTSARSLLYHITGASSCQCFVPAIARWEGWKLQHCGNDHTTSRRSCPVSLVTEQRYAVLISFLTLASLSARYATICVSSYFPNFTSPASVPKVM